LALAEDLRFSISFPNIPSAFARWGKWQSYVGSFLDRRPLPAEVEGWKIIRPEHRANPHVPWKIYKGPNAIVSDEPYTYLTLYANTVGTLSDRVHACVATLAYGKPAMLFSLSARSALFDRLGLSEIRERPTTLSPDKLRREKEGVLEFLRSALRSA
jgi:hypothetical protein